MARPLRIEYPGAFYHVMSRGNDRKAVFRQKEDYELFLETLADASERFDVLTYAFCLMPNHLHLLIQTKNPNLSQFMKRLLGVYTIRFNRRHKRHGHLFQGRYKAHLVDQDSYFLELSRYIHLNPVKAKLSEKPEKYTWSSMRFYLLAQTPSYLHKKFTLDSFDTPQAYQMFVREGIGLNDTLPKPTAGCFLGSEDFIKNYKKQIQKHQERDISGKRELFKTPIPKLRERIKNKDLGFQMYCLWKYGRLTQRSIGEMFQRTHAAVSQNVYRFGARLIQDKALNEEVNAVMSEFKD